MKKRFLLILAFIVAVIAPIAPRAEAGTWYSTASTCNQSRRNAGSVITQYTVQEHGGSGRIVATCYRFPEARRAYMTAVIEAMA